MCESPGPPPPDAPEAWLGPSPRDSNERTAAGTPAGSAEIDSDSAVVSAGVTRRLIDDHDRIAGGLNDAVRRLFAAGLDLQAALGLISDQGTAGKISHALGKIDQAISDIRDIIFDRG
jgi:hypothetical protein